MANGPSETKIVSLSTKITVIVFWGLILVGLVFAAILFQTMEETTLDGREGLADNVAYRIHEALDHSGLKGNQELANEIYEIGIRHPELHMELRRKGEPVVATSRDAPADQGHTITRLINFTPGNGESVSAELILNFPSLEATLHAQRSPLLVGLGFLLLLFGSVIKGLLDTILNKPLRQMVDTARSISEGKGDASLSFDAQRNDEFGYVSRFINRALEKMRESQELAWDAKELAEVTLHSIGDGVVTTDREGTVVFMNPVAQQMLGITLKDAAGKPLWDIMLIVDEGLGREIANPIGQCLQEHRSIELDDNYAILRSDDDKYPVEISMSPISGKAGAIHGAVIALHDVREARALQRELTYHASHDPLTGLYNRREFDRELQRALDHTRRDGEEHALCYLDLDQFKVVNDTCGHAAGYQLLQKLTAFLRDRLRKADVLARLGGDEFGVLLVHCPMDRAIKVAENLRVAIREFRFAWGDKSFQVGVSVGLVPVTQEQSGVAEILSAADMACYAAKEEGRNRVHVYQPSDELVSEKHGEMHWTARITRAIEEERFVLYCQPIIGLSDGAGEHYYVLFRRIHERGAIVPPGAFIPAAERYILMPAVDRWIINRLFSLQAENLRAWHRHEPDATVPHVAELPGHAVQHLVGRGVVRLPAIAEGARGRAEEG